MYILIGNEDKQIKTVDCFATMDEAVCRMKENVAQILGVSLPQLNGMLYTNGSDTPEYSVGPTNAWTEKYGTEYVWNILNSSSLSFPVIPKTADTDRKLEELWAALEDVSMDPETETIEERFLDFPAGTSRETIWHWFDERYSRGVYYLMYNTGEDHTVEIAKMTHLSEICEDCESRGCVYNHDGVCRYAMVHEKGPEITEEDGCLSGVIDETYDGHDGEAGECPLGGDVANDCDGCAYSGDYHYDPKSGECLLRSVVHASFVSVWDDGSVIVTDCKVNMDTNHVFDIQTIDVGEVKLSCEDEYVLIDGVRHNVMTNDDNEHYLITE